jgi:hypothetical protein
MSVCSASGAEIKHNIMNLTFLVYSKQLVKKIEEKTQRQFGGLLIYVYEFFFIIVLCTGSQQ